MPLREWKKLVNNIVKDFDYRSNAVRISLYETLASVRKTDNEMIYQWWVHCYYDPRFTKMSIFIVKLLPQISRLYIKNLSDVNYVENVY